jgi:uncharacterized membrane protein YphA (DoxX/SURF4 family)
MAQEGALIPQVALIIATIVALAAGLLFLFGLLTGWAAVVLGVRCILTAAVVRSDFADFEMQIHFWKDVASAGVWRLVPAPTAWRLGYSLNVS